MGLVLFCLLLGAPLFGLGYYRNWKVAAGLILVLAGLSAYYAHGLATAPPDDPAANEWGAQAAPAFFAWVAVLLTVAFALGFGTRAVIKRMREFGK